MQGSVLNIKGDSTCIVIVVDSTIYNGNGGGGIIPAFQLLEVLSRKGT